MLVKWNQIAQLVWSAEFEEVERGVVDATKVQGLGGLRLSCQWEKTTRFLLLVLSKSQRRQTPGDGRDRRRLVHCKASRTRTAWFREEE
jgi:hypothetical protein